MSESLPIRNPPSTTALVAIAVMAVCALVAALGWVGFISSDDLYYYGAGKAWISKVWYVPGHFGQIRSSVALPISASLLALGDREFAVVLPSTVYYVLLVAGTFVFASRLLPIGFALVQALLFCTFPVVVAAATTPSADIAEIFWAAMAFWAFAFAYLGRVRPGPALVACGAALALAFSGRETVIGLGLFIAACAVFTRRLAWRDYLWIVAGGLAVFFVEALYYTVTAGEPLLRLKLFLSGVESSNDRLAVPMFSFDDSGNLRIHATVDPLLMLLTKHHFGIGYWVLVPLVAAALIMYARRLRADGTANAQTETMFLLALGAGLVWLIFNMFALYRIKLLGRYYIAPTYFLVIAATAFLALHWQTWRKGFVVAVMAAALLANVLGLAVENKDPRFAERAVADALARVPGPLRTDPKTAYYAWPFVHWAGQDRERVVGGPPRPGSHFLWVRKNVEHPHRLVPKEDLPRYRFDPSWTVVERFQAPPLLPAGLAGFVGKLPMIPRPIMEKLVAPRGEAILVWVPR